MLKNVSESNQNLIKVVSTVNGHLYNMLIISINPMILEIKIILYWLLSYHQCECMKYEIRIPTNLINKSACKQFILLTIL